MGAPRRCTRARTTPAARRPRRPPPRCTSPKRPGSRGARARGQRRTNRARRRAPAPRKPHAAHMREAKLPPRTRGHGHRQPQSSATNATEPSSEERPATTTRSHRRVCRISRRSAADSSRSSAASSRACTSGRTSPRHERAVAPRRAAEFDERGRGVERAVALVAVVLVVGFVVGAAARFPRRRRRRCRRRPPWRPSRDRAELPRRTRASAASTAAVADSAANRMPRALGSPTRAASAVTTAPRSGRARESARERTKTNRARRRRLRSCHY